MNQDIEQQFFSYNDVANIVGRTNQTISRWVKQGLFPRPRQVSPHVMGWLRDDIEKWMEELPMKPKAQISITNMLKESTNQ